MKEVSLSNQSLERIFTIMVKAKPDTVQRMRELHALFDVLEEPVILFEEKARQMQSEWQVLTNDSIKTELKQSVRDEAKKKADKLGEDFKEVHECKVNILLNQSNIDTIQRLINISIEKQEVFGRAMIRELNEIRQSVCM